MKNKIKVIALIIGSVLLILGAYLLYDKLSEQTDANQLEIFDAPQGGGDLNDSDSENNSDNINDTNDENNSNDEGKEGESDSEIEIERTEDFLVFDENGNPVRLSDYFGKPIVLNFWASWCGPCRNEMPHFEAKYREIGKDVQFLMVNLTADSNETEGRAKKIISDNGYTFPVLFDTQAYAAHAYSIRSIPVTCFINKDGVLRAKIVGGLTMQKLEEGINLIK